jgi:hypothetical protein
MSFLIERIVRVNGEERQRSQIVAEYSTLKAMTVPIATLQPGAVLADTAIELELRFDPPLVTQPQEDDDA